MIETTKNLANIFFFLVVALIGILSYLQARKTLFAPIRTETFKLQLKAFEEILAFFQNRSESDFLDAFDFDRIVSLNTLQMADSYVGKFFHEEIKIDKDAREKAYAPLIGAIVSKDYMTKYFEKVDTENPVHKSTPEEKKITNPAIVLANWQKYEHGMTGYTKDYQDQLKELTRLSASPLLPKPLREHIGRFRAVAHENLTLAGQVISECSKLMPQHFPIAADMKDFTPTWVWNEFNEKRQHFEPIAKEILDYMNGYLKIENLMQ
jgi:hypothetical protein